MSRTIEIYTDGGSRRIGKPDMLGGWGFVAVYYDKIIDYKKGSDPILKTNNQNEIYAVIASLKNIDNLPSKVKLDVYSDSAYVVNCINDKWYEGWRKNGWKNAKKEPVANKELWEELLNQIERVKKMGGGTEVSLLKVKGHSGNKWNEYADDLVNEAMDEVESNEA